MQSLTTLTPDELSEFLLAVATVRPVFIWGPPGIGTSSLGKQCAASVGLERVRQLGSQTAPEDLRGEPQIEDGDTRLSPPAMIARAQPSCLLLDELKTCSQDIQESFYGLIQDRRIGESSLPEGSIVIGAGSRSQDCAIVTPMPRR